MTKPNLRQAAVVALTLATLAAPAFAFADTTTDVSSLQAQIQALLQQVATLRAQIQQAVGSTTHPGDDQNEHGMMGTTTPGFGQGMGGGQLRACPMPSRDLEEGASGDDVKELQQFLQQNVPSFASTTPTGFFGPMTARAMREFQTENGIASSTSGRVGPLTRSFFGKRCGEQEGRGRGPGNVGSTTPSGDRQDGRGPGGPMGVRGGSDQGNFGPGMMGGSQDGQNDR